MKDNRPDQRTKINKITKIPQLNNKKKTKETNVTKKKLDNETDEFQESDIDLDEGQFENEEETDVGFEEDYIDEEIEDEDKLDNDNEVDDEIEKHNDEDDECYFKYVKEDYDDEYFEDEEIEIPTVLKELKGDERIGKPVLFYDERIRLLGDRTKQLSQSAKCMVKNTDHLTDLKKAELEIEYGVCPILIKRNLPNGFYEKWHINELKR